MALQLIYLVFSKLLSWLVLRTQADTVNEIEILVLPPTGGTPTAYS